MWVVENCAIYVVSTSQACIISDAINPKTWYSNDIGAFFTKYHFKDALFLGKT
jgi:hypothetical protein